MDYDERDRENFEENNNSDTSQLIDPVPNNTGINFVNILNNILCLVFSAYIAYMSFKHGVFLYSFHPTLTTLGWLLLLTTGIASLSPGNATTEWIPIQSRPKKHWILQICALFCITSGFIVIIVNKFIYNKNHFTSIHSWVGLASFILSFMLSFSGIFALFSNRFSRYILVTSPTLKLTHAFGGIVTFPTGLVAIFLGLFPEWDKFELPIRVSGITILIAILLLTLARPSVNIYFRFRNRSPFTL